MISNTEELKGEGQPSLLLSTSQAQGNHGAILPTTPTKFEDLNVELIRDIFDLFWTEAKVLYHAFYDLNLRLNKILQQTKFHITNSSYSLAPQTIHPEQIKSLYIKTSGRREILAFLTSLSPEIMVSLKLEQLLNDDLIRSILSTLINFQKLKTLNLHVPLISEQSCSIATVNKLRLSRSFGSPLHSSTIVNFSVRFIDPMSLDKLYAALPNLKRLAMFPHMEEQNNSTPIHSLSSIPPPSLKYLHLRLIRLENFPFQYIEFLLKTFPPTQLECLSIFEVKGHYSYSDIESWFSIFTMPTLKLKQLRIRLDSKDSSVYLVQRLLQHFGGETQIIQLETNPHMES
ncbi:unnamed protein product [Adineta steineri]|uniref:Uncharacterized protein n=1 Tax=Adineta steineri TaxID=433720 RepID=A0A815NY69_9BILA|nr:unnamed protein product [Adineta steineri]CAF3980736.1 unnamed protein product [Adineta steineri]